MIEWTIRGREFANCNCSYGCPCQFNALPTDGTCKAAADSLIKIAPTKITWQGKTSNFTKVHYAGPNAIELEDDGQEEPYGIVLDQGGKSGALVGPGHSPIPLTRCGG